MMKETTNLMTQMFGQAADAAGEAMTTGRKFQEQGSRFFTDTCEKTFDQFRTQSEKMCQDAVPTARKNFERFHTVFGEQTRKGFDFVRDTVDRGKGTPWTTAADQAADFWQASFETVQRGAETFAKANCDMMKSFADTAGRTVATATAKTEPKTAK